MAQQMGSGNGREHEILGNVNLTHKKTWKLGKKTKSKRKQTRKIERSGQFEQCKKEKIKPMILPILFLLFDILFSAIPLKIGKTGKIQETRKNWENSDIAEKHANLGKR